MSTSRACPAAAIKWGRSFFLCHASDQIDCTRNGCHSTSTSGLYEYNHRAAVSAYLFYLQYHTEQHGPLCHNKGETKQHAPATSKPPSKSDGQAIHTAVLITQSNRYPCMTFFSLQAQAPSSLPCDKRNTFQPRHRPPVLSSHSTQTNSSYLRHRRQARRTKIEKIRPFLSLSHIHSTTDNKGTMMTKVAKKTFRFCCCLPCPASPETQQDEASTRHPRPSAACVLLPWFPPLPLPSSLLSSGIGTVQEPMLV